jgi:RNA polymerase sigma factor (sigma-70 family)
MLNDIEARQLMLIFIELKNKYIESNSEIDKIKLEKHRKICIKKFKYLVTMKTNKYKKFSNYEDLNQEGLEALTKAMSNYKPNLGSWFWWAHKYIDTRISRSANLHTTIRYPLRIAKITPPHREIVMPLLIEDKFCPEKELEISQTKNVIKKVMLFLNEQQKTVISLAYGFNGDKPMSINKICKNLNISRVNCITLINDALFIMKEKIKI